MKQKERYLRPIYGSLCLVLAWSLMVLACSTPAQPKPASAPSIGQQKSQLTPQNDQFSGLPIHIIGEMVEAGGYRITLENLRLDNDQVQVSAALVNNSQHPIELSTALYLYAPDGQRIAPQNATGTLAPGNTIQQEFSYTLSGPIKQEDIMGYRLLYTPLGWSGPVIAYLLVTSLPDVPPPPTPPEGDIPKPAPASDDDITSQAYNGITGDPWKMLILIYPNINTDYVENGVTKHLTASMPAGDIAAMRADFMNNQPHRNVVYDYSGNTAEMEATVIEVSRPLTSLAPIGSGYWPDPDIVRPELNLYAPTGKYDSVIVFWQASDPNTSQSIPSPGWGLGYWPGDYANGMTYASVFNLSWVWPNDGCRGEVFLHEWLHGVTGYYASLGFPFNIEDLHGAEEAGYQWDYDQDGCWDMWLRDYMRGLVYENGQRKALVPQTWQGGSITTHHINGWRGEYFDNETLSGIPVLVRDDANVNFDWQSNAPHPLVPADHFSARWTKITNFNQGTYTFDLLRDDGIRLKIDGVTVLDAWSPGHEWVSTAQYMTQGNHMIVVESYEINGGAAAILQYSFCSACGPATSAWPVYRQDMRRTGRSPLTGPASPVVLWSYDAGSYDGSSPVIAPDNTIYVGLNKKLYAFTPNGGVKWSYTTGGSVKSPALAADGTIYAASSDGKLYALNPNGSLKWAFTTGDWINDSPAIAPDGVVYIGSADGKLYAIRSDGTLKWTYTIGSWQNPSPALGLDNTIYQGSTTWDMYALTPTGQLKWQYHTNGYVDATPALGVDGTLYFGSWDHSLYALNPNGTLKWTYPTGGAVGTVAIGADSTLYVGNEDKYIYAINSNGTLKWRYLTDGVAWTPSIDGNGIVYAGSQDGYLYALNPSGSLKWRIFLGDWPNSSPVIGSNQMLYITFNGKISAIAPSVPKVTLQSIGSQDGFVLESSETSNLGGTFNATAATINLGDNAARRQYRGILSFNTASLPDNAVITGATLKVQKQGIVGGGNPVTIFQGFMVDIKKGLFGTAALQASDFQAAASKSYGPFNTALVGSWYSINLASPDAYINKLSTNGGLTQIRLRFKLDDNNNTLANYLSLYSGNAPAANRPQLVITYTIP